MSKDRILSLLGSGLQPSLVASAVGCDPSYITQLLSDQAFSSSVALLRVRDIEKVQQRDGKYNEVEDDLIQKLQDLIPFMLRPREVLQAISVVNGAKRRSEVFTEGTANQQVVQNIVVLQMPSRTINQFELSPQNEVISIEGKSLTPMPSSALLRELSSLATQEVLKNDATKRTVETQQNEISKETSEGIPRGTGSRNLSPEILERTSFSGSV